VGDRTTFSMREKKPGF